MLETILTKEILHTTDNYIKSLKKGGIETIKDMLFFFPKNLEDRSIVLDSFSYINIKEKNTILVKIISVENTKTSNKKLLTKVVFEDKNGFLSEGVWFNRDYLSKNFKKLIQKKVIVSGKVKYDFGKLSFISPEIETNLSKVNGEVIPIYSDFNYIPGSWISSKMEFLKNYTKCIDETLPEKIIKKYNFIPKSKAIELLHFPSSKNDFEIAQNRLAYEELFEINYKSILNKLNRQENSEGKSVPIPLNPDLIKDILQKIPFKLTDHQKISLFQILKDIEKTHSMQRLLQGDVGSGKTIVAGISIIHSILESKGQGKIQASILAPTEILARQHFEGLKDFFESFGLKTTLLVGSTKAKEKKEIKEKIRNQDFDIIIGTHAILQEDVIFKKLGLVIIDEQHRFGVSQRNILEKNNSFGVFPHVLNMTATPIPRTLAITLYGDQDLSIISQMPSGRKEIITKIVNNNHRHQIELFIENQITSGRQVFWISPLVEESEKIDLANAVNTFENLKEIFRDFKVGLLHGKMKAKEKEEIMKQFKNNEIQILSSTSVVEVGVNIPNATIMCIEGAERFGLSQLHQFRGRVGRGKYQSYCYLFPTSGQKTDRLKAMEKTNNGFELSEIDLELRGPGEVYGVRQSGIPEFKIADIKDLELVGQIREDIEELLKVKNK
ncbi:ATP-dependent DNA helicase RecG [Candidatus Gracilibacteria bacterium]|nr:ATP-dependent DNA helicase RecG [Candidatus Gracilibacteria bacterium]